MGVFEAGILDGRSAALRQRPPAIRPFREESERSISSDGRRWSVDGHELMGYPIVPVGDGTRFEPNEDGIEAVSFDTIAWQILYPAPKGKLPSSAIIDVYVGLMFLYYLQGFPADGRVYFSRYQLLNLIGWFSPGRDANGKRTRRPSGRHYRQLKRALLYLEGTRFVADDPVAIQFGPDGSRFVGMQGFPILQYVRLVEESPGFRGEIETTGSSMVQFSEPFVALIGGGTRTIRLDFDLFLNLSTGTPRLLFRLLTWLQNRGRNEIPLEELLPRIGSTQKHFVAARARQILNKAHRELKEHGVLASDPVYEKVNGRYVVRYEFGDPSRFGTASNLLIRAAEAFGVDAKVARELAVAHRKQFERVLAATALEYLRPTQSLPGMIVHYTRRGYEILPRRMEPPQLAIALPGDEHRYIDYLHQERERRLRERPDLDLARIRSEVEAQLPATSNEPRPDWVLEGLALLRLDQLLGLPTLAEFRLLDMASAAS